MRLRSNDNVIVIKGRDRGKRGRITQAFPKENKVLVEGVNTVMRHTKPTGTMRQAGIIKKELPIHVGNVMLICLHCNKPSRIGYKTLPDGTKARACKNCVEVIE